VSRNEQTYAPPHPFDLTTLQLEANRCLGLNPKMALDLCQKLYLGGFIVIVGWALYTLNTTLNIILIVILVAYIPMTHMAHFFLKWFTWHKIRWDDEPNKVGSAIEKKVMQQVNYPVSWSAPHIKADGKKTWVDIATEEVDRDA